MRLIAHRSLKREGNETVAEEYVSKKSWEKRGKHFIDGEGG
jgi:hypothetical protein